MSNGIAFTNLHISQDGWSVTGHQRTGVMNTWDLSKCDEAQKEALCDILSKMIQSEASILIEHSEHGLQ